METVPNWVIGLVVGLASLGMAAVGVLAAKIKDTDSRGREIGVILTEIKNLATKVDGIIASQAAQTITCRNHGERVAAVEQSAKSAHHRLDALEAAVRSRQNGGVE